MRALLLAVAFLLALLPGCSMPEPERPTREVEASAWLHGDTRFNREERLIWEYACDGWRTFSRGKVNFWIRWDLDEETFLDLREQPRVLRLDSTDPRFQAVDFGLRDGRARAFHRPPDGTLPLTIAVAADRVPELYPVALHELGHAAGVEDLPRGRAGVMSRTAPAWKFTRADWDACRAASVCAGSSPP